MTTLFAQPYDIMAAGFYFDDAETYQAKVAAARNAHGDPVEEFEIQFIDGEAMDARLFDALGVHQASVAEFFGALDAWGDIDKVKVIVAVGEVGCSFTLGSDDPERLEVDLYECETLRDLAMQFVDDGLFGEIPAQIQGYLDYDAIAHDLGMDYTEITIAGTHYVWRCG